MKLYIVDLYHFQFLCNLIDTHFLSLSYILCKIFLIHIILSVSIGNQGHNYPLEVSKTGQVVKASVHQVQLKLRGTNLQLDCIKNYTVRIQVLYQMNQILMNYGSIKLKSGLSKLSSDYFWIDVRKRQDKELTKVKVVCIHTYT